ncbi:MAG: hypothetical protein R6X19_06895 [Kiritimatiellia bacterium]
MPIHPVLQQFKKALADRTVTNAPAFNKWRLNPEKCKGEDKEEADKLWAQYEAQGASMSHGIRADSPSRPGAQFRGNRPAAYSDSGKQQSKKVRNTEAADPAILAQSFHNPYTFLPFPSEKPKRGKPTPLSVDETDKDRFTGILDLDIRLLSPLLSSHPDACSEDNGHKTFRALSIGNDIIVPSTGVKGSLRTLMTILTGGTLGYVDDEAWLCQGRDARLGPAGRVSRGQVPDNAFLAEVVNPGGFGKEGTIRLGKTELITWSLIEEVAQRQSVGIKPNRFRPKANAKVNYLWMNDTRDSIRDRQDTVHCWKIKLSGRPIIPRGKREGLFKADSMTIVLPSHLWSAYAGRNRHGDHQELKPGDLVWLEPASFGLTEIKLPEDVKSLQWARWGREGERLLDIIDRRHNNQLPDSLNPDGQVDEITNLFGQVPRSDLLTKEGKSGDPLANNGPAPSFAARIRSGNLIFKNSKTAAQPVALAPMAQPHPGCAAFYRQAGADMGQAADIIGNHNLPLRGYKVYRTTKESGPTAPWNYSEQAIFGDQGTANPDRQKLNKTADLLMPDKAPTGKLRLTLRALSKKELVLLLAACSVDWRLGGGKPLGLGHCRITSAALREFHDDGSLGAPLVMQRNASDIAPLPDVFGMMLESDECKLLRDRMNLWQASQSPVDKLRYPRAVVENRERKSRGGHVWFQRHAAPQKAANDGDYPEGLQALHLEENSELHAKAARNTIRAQPLPQFRPEVPQADVLYGYDLFSADNKDARMTAGDKRTLHKKLEPFDPEKHGRASDRSSGNTSQNRDSRQSGRDNR